MLSPLCLQRKGGLRAEGLGPSAGPGTRAMDNPRAEVPHGGESPCMTMRQSSHCLLHPGRTATISILAEGGKGARSTTTQRVPVTLWEIAKGFPPPPCELATAAAGLLCPTAVGALLSPRPGAAAPVSPASRTAGQVWH